MINIFTFLTLLLLFVRIYSLVSLLFLSEKRVQFAERITVFILLFEVLTIYSILNLALAFTFGSQNIFKFINRFLVGIILLTNIIYGFMLII